MDKKRPGVVEVRTRMAEIQKVIDDGDFDEDEVVNPDETGVFYGAPPKQQYIPSTAERATSAPSDDKARFTSLLWGSTAGKMKPSFKISSRWQ